VVRTAFFTRDVEAGTLTSSEPPPHPEATRATETSRPATVFMPQACHNDQIAVQGVSPTCRTVRKASRLLSGNVRACRRRPRRPPDGGASPVPRGARPAAASIRHACSPHGVAAPARRHELSDPHLGTGRFGQGRNMVSGRRRPFPTPHTHRTRRQEARTGLPVLVTPTRRCHRVTQPFSRLLGGIWGDAAFPT
jgi:hypothetical protein